MPEVFEKLSESSSADSVGNLSIDHESKEMTIALDLLSQVVNTLIDDYFKKWELIKIIREDYRSNLQ